MNLPDASGIASLLKDVLLIKERFDRQGKLLEEQDKLISSLQAEIARLTTRVAVLEEGRKTTGAEGSLAIERAIHRLDLEWLKADVKRQLDATPKDK